MFQDTAYTEIACYNAVRIVRMVPLVHHICLSKSEKNLEARKFSFNEEKIEAAEAWFAEQDTFSFERSKGDASW